MIALRTRGVLDVGDAEQVAPRPQLLARLEALDEPAWHSYFYGRAVALCERDGRIFACYDLDVGPASQLGLLVSASLVLVGLYWSSPLAALLAAPLSYAITVLGARLGARRRLRWDLRRAVTGAKENALPRAQLLVDPPR